MKKIFGMLIFTICLLFSSLSMAQSTSIEHETLVKIDKALLYLLKYTPNHPVVKNKELRDRFSRAIYMASTKSGYDWSVITAVTYAESSFKVNAKGKIGELGVMQLHGVMPWRHCRRIEGRKVNKNLLEDQFICGAHWLRFGQERVCKSDELVAALAKYMTRGTCKPKRKSKLDWKVQRRLLIAEKISSPKVQG